MPQDPNKITYFGTTNSRGESVPFGIKRIDRQKHMYVIGKTGMGKSTMLENMAIQDIRNGEGMAFIDPHGGTADRIIEYVPEHRKKDVLYFAPFDMEYPVAFNVMEDVGYDKRHLVVSGLMSAFKKLWVDTWSARMEYILTNTLLALLEYPGSTLLDVNTMYTNKAFRAKVVDNIKDPVIKRYWVEEYAGMTDRFAAEATPAIQNKVGQFTSNPLIRNIIGQSKSSFDLREMMDQKKIIIINLSKGRVGDVNAQLLGSILVTKIYLAAMSRADSSASVLATLPNFYFYVDEFQNFANQSFADILSEARKYKLNLIIAHQYVEQMEEEVRDAVFGNVGTTVAFRVGPFDADVLETIFQPVFMATDLVNLGVGQIYLTLMIDGVGSPPFSASTLRGFDPPPANYFDEVIANSRAQYGRSRQEIEKVIEDAQLATPFVATDTKPKVKYTPPSSTYKPPQKAATITRPVPIVESAPAPKPAPVVFEEQIAAEVASIPKPIERPTPKPAPKPYVAKPAPAKPALSGATSLRDALLQAQAHAGKQPEAAPAPAPAPAPRVHAPDLKSTLHTVAPQAEAGAARPASVDSTRSQPAQLPESEIRTMLDVDEDMDLDLS
jgi:hypothetical protein